MAILTGDGLLTSAFEAMNKDMLLYFDEATCLKCRVKASYEIAKGSGCRGMVAGQAADIEVASKFACGEMLDYIYVNKTGALITAAIRAGAHLGNADLETLKNLSNFAENLGLAYQINDDILDITGKEEIMGKQPGHDAKINRCTYVSVNGIENSQAKVKELTENALVAMSQYYDNAEFFNKLALDLSVRVK